MSTRGIRNYNPFNIRRSSSRWLGLSDVQSDKDFCQFKYFTYGVRAGLYIFCRYYFDYHLNTISDIISRFAPESENSTKHYIVSVSRSLGYLPNSRLKFDRFTLFKLAQIICQIESYYDLSEKTFNEAFDMLPNRFKKLLSYGKS